MKKSASVAQEIYYQKKKSLHTKDQENIRYAFCTKAWANNGRAFSHGGTKI